MRPRVVVFDYGSGNIRSAERAVVRAGADVTVTADFDAALAADGLVVPGVGAFAACMHGLQAARGDELIGSRLAAGRPVLGICVGLQVLFERGVEHGVETPGCGRWPGVVERLQAYPIPHMGWNTVEVPAGSRLFAGVERERFYFVHSYGVRSWQHEARGPGPEGTNSIPRKRSASLPRFRGGPGWSGNPGPLVTWTPYAGDRFVAAVEDGVLAATQFHPEKSGDAGAQLLANWIQVLES